MTVIEFLKEHNSKLKSSKKLNVRDLDEIEKNNFVAYVDENEDCYDVKIVFDNKQNIITTECDCDNNGVCNHIVALANFLTENKKEKSVIKKTVKRKLSETDEILETLDNETIKIWLSETLNKNKELAFSFKNQFGMKSLIIDETEIKKIIKESISSIIGKRRTVQTNEVKKIVDALNISLQPVLENLFSKVNKENFKLLNCITDELEKFHFDYYLSSVRITNYIKNLQNELLKSLFNLKNFDEWLKATQFFIGLIFKDKFTLNELYLVEKIYEVSKTNELQRKTFSNILEDKYINLYKGFDGDFSLLNFEIEKFVLTMFVENNLLENYYNNFKPRRFQNTHNLILINELLRIDKFDIAEKYCVEQISSNINKDYDLPYAKILINIYKHTNETVKLANILCEFGKYIFNIEDYLFIKKYATEEKFKKYRQSLLTNARYAYQSGDIEAFDFYFELKKIDNKQSDIFEMLINGNNIEYLDKYKEVALQLNAAAYLKSISRFSYYYSYNEEIVESIANFVVDNIETELLSFYLKSITRTYENEMILRIKSKTK